MIIISIQEFRHSGIYTVCNKPAINKINVTSHCIVVIFWHNITVNVSILEPFTGNSCMAMAGALQLLVRGLSRSLRSHTVVTSLKSLQESVDRSTKFSVSIDQH